MLIRKFCFLICAIFLILSLYDVIRDSQSIQYSKSKKKAEIFNFSFCIKLNEELLKNFEKPSSNLYQFTVKELVESTCLKLFSNSGCNSSIDLNKSYLFNYHSCLVFEHNDFDTLIRKLNETDFRIYAFSNYISEIHFFENIFENVAKLEPFTLTLEYIEYRHLESPYETDCYQYSNENINFETKEIVNSRPSCFLECFKTESRSLNYYYSMKDDKSLLVHKDELKILKEIGDWRTFDKNLTVEHENKCLNLCKRGGCIFRVYLVNEFTGTNQTEFNLTYETYIFTAKPSTSKIQTSINFISLIVLFLNISFYETIPYLIKKTLSIYLKNYLNLFNRYYWILKLIFFILCLFAIICLSLFRIFDYLKNDFNNLVAFNFPTDISPFYLMICVPVQVLVDNHSELDKKNEISLLQTKSFAELENSSDFNKFESGLERIYIQYASIEKEVDYSIDKNKIVFRSFDYEIGNNKTKNLLLRCYKIDLKIRELRYEMLYSLSKLKIILKFNWYVVYPVPQNFNLTTHSDNLISDPYLYKVINEEKFNCSNYSEDKLFSNLSDCVNGINQCVNEEHLKNYYSLTIQSVIYKDKIPPEYKLDHVYFNQSINETILDKCKKKFKTNNCFSQFFRINMRQPVNQINQTFSMNLYYVEYLRNDNIILSLSDLLLNNLLSFESILIGLNIGKILFILFSLIKRYKLKRIQKYYKYFKFIILLIGLSIHLYYIFDNISNSGLILITKYTGFKSIQLPNLIFCFEIQNYNEIDFNYKQNSNYLNDFTENLNLSFFKNVSFLDNNLNEIFYIPYQNGSNRNLDEIKTIYFLNLKCFEFVFKLIESNKYFHILNDLQFVSFKFNRKIISKYFEQPFIFDFYLITRKKSTNELNGIEKINFNYDNENHSLIKVYQKLNMIEVKKKFTFIQNPLSIFYDQVNLDDTKEYIDKLLDDLKKLNFRTKKIVMDSIDSNYQYENTEIDDEIFDQYFYQIKNVSDFTLSKALNFKREVYITKIKKVDSKYDENYDVDFYFFPLLETYTFTNRDSYSKFIISILNCLNIWLNFCCLDLYIYLRKLLKLVYKFYRIVLSFKYYLKQKKIQMLLQSL